MEQLTKTEIINTIKLLDGQIHALDANKLSLYKPHDGCGGFDPSIENGQIAFHRSQAPIRMMVTGNRGGKTEASIMEASWLATGTHPYRKMKIPCKGKLYGESFPVIMETLWPKLEKWLPKSALDPRKPFHFNQMGYLTRINFLCGSFIAIGSYDQEYDKAEGSDWDFVGFDEPPPRELFVALMRGLVDRGICMWFSMTPLKEAWIYDELWQPGVAGTKKHVETFNWSSYGNPYVNKEALDLFASDLTPDERLVRIEGLFKKLQGLVIKTYEPEYSDIEPFELDDNFSIYEGLDVHSDKPNCALWKAIDQDGFRYAVGELSFDGGIYDFGQAIAEYRNELCKEGARIVASISDNSLNQKDMMFKINQKDELCRSLREAGEAVMPVMANKRNWVLPGIKKMIDLFRVIDHGGWKGPTEYLFDGCVPNYKSNLLHYQWPDKIISGVTMPVKKWDDFIDPSRYIESIAPKFTLPSEQALVHTYKGAYSERLSYADRRS